MDYILGNNNRNRLFTITLCLETNMSNSIMGAILGILIVGGVIAGIYFLVKDNEQEEIQTTAHIKVYDIETNQLINATICLYKNGIEQRCANSSNIWETFYITEGINYTFLFDSEDYYSETKKIIAEKTNLEPKLNYKYLRDKQLLRLQLDQR